MREKGKLLWNLELRKDVSEGAGQGLSTPLSGGGAALGPGEKKAPGSGSGTRQEAGGCQKQTSPSPSQFVLGSLLSHSFQNY